MLKKLNETTDFLKQKIKEPPDYGIVLGTGLGGLVREIEIDQVISYEDIPNFPVSTVESHSGKLFFGSIGNKRVITQQGRFHYYEGYDMQQVIFPIRVMSMLGVKCLMISNASGGLNPSFEISDLMLVNDHINLMPESPVGGTHFEELGARFPDLSDAYDVELISRAESIARKNNIKLHKGVYVAVPGPALETPAEYKYLRTIGGDTVGMSTVPEVIVARQMEMRVFAVSVITDLGVPGKIEKLTIEKVIEAAMKAEPSLTLLMKELITSI